MTRPLTPRQAAEAIEEFGDELASLIKAFERKLSGMNAAHFEAINAIPHQEWLDDIAQGYRAAGERLNRECDHAEEAEDRRRDNPLEPDFRRIG